MTTQDMLNMINQIRERLQRLNAIDDATCKMYTESMLQQLDWLSDWVKKRPNG